MTTSTTGTDAPNQAPTAASAAGTAEPDDPGAIPMLRAQIDALDAAIINLVAERAKLSTRIQTARINGGGARVQLGRERVILEAYRSGLGLGGANLADAILQVCRGSF
jgi:chorismate mutase